ncbi:hypothetical protein [Nonomuraea sp. JJY05]|uniref:hypothetical protein n=1 Tax=Nonomuraea sp. JJY05 TaxID=3350255 RepID=UPI00373F8F5D
MKFLAITLIVHDGRKSTNERFRADRRQVHRYHDRFGHEVMHLHADADGLTDARHRSALELFQSDIAPVLRKEIPSRPFPGGSS